MRGAVSSAQAVDLPPLPFRRAAGAAIPYRDERCLGAWGRGRGAVFHRRRGGGSADAFGDGLTYDQMPVESVDAYAQLVAGAYRLRRFRAVSVHAHVPGTAGGGRSGYL